MESILIIVTTVALSLAVGMTLMAWKLLRDDRRRSALRVETLETLAAADEPLALVTEPRRRAPASSAPRRDATLATARAASRREIEIDALSAPVVAARFSALDDDLDVEETWEPEHPALPASMFRATSERRGHGRRWLLMASVAIIMAGGAGAAYGFVKSGQSFAALRAIASPPQAPIVATSTHPIELLSLRHAADRDGSFSVTGLVHNPADGQRLHHVTAVVYLFDQDGNYFASGRATLDSEDLQPGDESPFVIHVPSVTRVGRYRIGFRTDEGTVAHVDKRGAPQGDTAGTAVTVARSAGIE